MGGGEGGLRARKEPSIVGGPPKKYYLVLSKLCGDQVLEPLFNVAVNVVSNDELVVGDDERWPAADASACDTSRLSCSDRVCLFF